MRISKFIDLFFKSFLMTFGLTFFFLNSAFSWSQDTQYLKLVLFSSPDCTSCQLIEHYLSEKKSEYDLIDFFYDGRMRPVTLEVINPLYLSKRDIQEMGLKKAPKVPFLGLFHKELPPSKKSPFIRGFSLNEFSESDLHLLKEKGKHLGQTYFHIRKGENIDHYKQRMNQFLELNTPLIDRILETGKPEASQEEFERSSQSLQSLEIGQPLSLEGKDLLKPNIIFIGNADHPFNNPLFTPLVIKKIQKDITNHLNLNHQRQIITLFGSGHQKARDVFQINKKQEVQLISRPPHNNINGSFNRKNLYQLFRPTQSIGNGRKKKRLIIMIGHGAREGALLWFEKKLLKKSELKSYHLKSNATNVMVSGTCYGGQFYDSISCGFFGAHPKTPAVGCWSYEDHIISKKDYTRTFFSSLNHENKEQADFNKDGLLSFEEMHWFALLNGPKEDLPFTSIDGLARRFFRNHQKPFQELKSLDDFKELISYATAGERAALKSLVKGIPNNEIIHFEETPTKSLKTKNDFVLSLKIDALNPFESNTVFRFSPKDRKTIKKIIKHRIKKMFKGGIDRISFKKYGPKVFFQVFFHSGKRIKFYDNFNMTRSGKLKGSFFEIPLSPNQRKKVLKGKNKRPFTSKKFKLLPKKWQKVKNQYLKTELLNEFIRVGKKGETIIVGIRYRDQLNPWPKIMILGMIENKVPKYRMALPQILKRLFFKKVVKKYPFYFSKFKSFEKCEQQKVKHFLTRDKRE